MTNRIRHILGTVIVVALVSLGGWSWYDQQLSEPVYQGKRLSDWLEEYQDDFVPMDAQLRGGRAAEAIREIGTNALPLLLRLSRAKGISVAWKLEQLIGGHTHRGRDPAFRRHRLAWGGFAALGSMAKPAVPALMESLKDERAAIRRSAALCLGYIGPEADAAVPLLIEKLKDDDHRTRSFATWALGNINTRGDLVIPALLHHLRSSEKNDPNLADTIAALSNYGRDAKTAIPLLEALLESQNFNTRWWASEALRRIDAQENERGPL